MYCYSCDFTINAYDDEADDEADNEAFQFELENFVINGSFEDGPPNRNLTPKSWLDCGLKDFPGQSSPDTHGKKY